MLVSNSSSISGFPYSLHPSGVVIPLLKLARELKTLVFPFYAIKSVLAERLTSVSSGCGLKKYLFELLLRASICYTKERWEQIAAPQLWGEHLTRRHS